MHRPTYHRTLLLTGLLAGLLSAPAAFAEVGIVKCVDDAGHVTITDQGCGNAAVAIPLVTEADAADTADTAAQPVAASALRHALPAVRRMRHDSPLKKPGVAGMLSRDVATLKEARINMQVMDKASAALRQQRLAGLN